MSSLDARETERSSSSLLRSLVVNQTIGLLALVGLVVALRFSAGIQSLVSRASLGAHIARWLAAKAAAVSPSDVLWIVVMIGLMIGWTVLLQRISARGGAVSRAEWRPSVSRGVLVALYLVASASVVEEVVFRGIALPAAAYYLGPLGGLAVSAVLSGLLHFEKGVVGQLVVVGYGVILGGGLLLGSSLLACVAAHAAGNALAMFLGKR